MIDHFSSGVMTPLLSFVLSCAGCGAGLSAVARARAAVGRTRLMWLTLGTLALGGTGIFVMHFVAMFGFSIPGHEIRFDIPTTALSALVALVAVGIGLLIVDRFDGRLVPLLIGGTATGLGVAGMHYLGMSAMHTDIGLHYSMPIVALSLLIAVVAASAGLWLAFNVANVLAGVGATVLMAIAVSGMHYTGMFAMSAEGPGRFAPGEVPGFTASELLMPLILVLSFSTFALLVVVAIAPTPQEIRADEEFREALSTFRATDEVEATDGRLLRDRAEQGRSPGAAFGGPPRR